MSKYAIPYNRTVNSLVPHFLRGNRLLNLIYTCVAPLQILNNNFVTYRDSVYEFLVHDSRKIYFEKRLNDLFDDSLRGIYIITNSTDVQSYIYKLSEGIKIFNLFKKSELQTETYLYKKSESLGTVSFTVYVPTYVATDDMIIEATIKQYLTSGKNFEIVRV